MFPFRDHNPSRRRAYVTYALIITNIVIFLVSLGLTSDNAALAQFYGRWAMIPSQVSSGNQLHTLGSSMFLHAGFMHLAGNMLFLWVFGDNMEDAFGHIPFLIFYLACGVVADVAHLMADTASMVPTIGASGAIAGVLGGYLLLYPKARVDVLFIFIIFFKVFPIPAWIVLGVWFALQIFSGVSVDVSGGGVAYWAHAGGFVAGLLLTIPWWRKNGASAFWSRNHGHPPHPDAFKERVIDIPVIRRR